MNSTHTHPDLHSASSGRPYARAKPITGFTLPEVVTAIAVLSVLLAIAVPAFGTVVNSVKLTSSSTALLSDLHLARSEAIKRNARVVLCKSADGDACVSTGGWEQGGIVFHDANNNAARDPGEAIIHRGQALSAELRISGSRTIAQYVSYGPHGQSMLSSGAFQAGTFTLCSRSAEPAEAHQIVINAGGRPRLAKTTVASCA